MLNQSGKIDDDLDVTEDLAISGQMNANVTVNAGATLHISGQNNGVVVVHEGGGLVQSGQLNGVIICQGWADITGQINGTVEVDGGVVLVAEGVQRNTKDEHLVLDSSGQWRPIAPGTLTKITVDARRWRWSEDGSFSPANGLE